MEFHWTCVQTLLGSEWTLSVDLMLLISIKYIQICLKNIYHKFLWDFSIFFLLFFNKNFLGISQKNVQIKLVIFWNLTGYVQLI